MSAPSKEYLDYYNWYCNAFDVDRKLKKLSRKYGPLGETIYRRMLDLIYSNSYYLEADLEDAAMMVVDKIGSKWVSDEKCAEVLVFCSELGLFERDLVKRKVWTAVSIQKRYFHIMNQLRRKVDVSQKKYLLLDIPLSAEKNNNYSEETEITSEETEVNTTKKKGKEINKDINDLYDLFENSFARPLTQIEMQKIIDWRNVFNEEMIEYALELAVTANAISLRYIESIINNWMTNNISSIESAKLQSESMKKKKGGKKYNKNIVPMPKYIQEEKEPAPKMTDAEMRKLTEMFEKLEY